MNSKLATELNKHLNAQAPTKVILDCLERIELGDLTIDDNPESHFCIYFAAYSQISRSVFIGHHKKSGLWLFNGGHIDEDETLMEALKREIKEEWGLKSSDFEINDPAFFSITKINNPTKQKCLTHYDVWFFVETNQEDFTPFENNLLEEFHEADWKNFEEARGLISDDSTLLALDFIEENLI